jgi:hypothetical protein
MSSLGPIHQVNKTRKNKNPIGREALRLIEQDPVLSPAEKSRLYNGVTRIERRQKLANQRRKEAKHRMVNLVYETNFNDQASVDRLKAVQPRGGKRRTHRGRTRR